MPAFKHCVGGLSKAAEATTANAEQLQSSMSRMVDAHRGDSGAIVARGKRSAAVPKTAAYQLLRAWDHALSVYGSGLLRFRPYPERSRLLAPGELRYTVEVAKWGDYSVPGAVPWLKVVVKNMQTGEKRYEQPARWDAGKPSVLVLIGDEDSSNLSAFQWTASVLHLRTVYVRDVAHRAWNDCKLSLQDADCWRDIIETCQVMQTLHGPWSSAAWYKQLTESAHEHMRLSNSSDPLFDVLFERLAEDFKGTLKSAEGTAEFREEVWQRLCESPVLDKKGCRVSTTRWFNWFEQYAEFDGHYHSYLFFFVLLALHTDIFRSIWEAPIFGAEIAPGQLQLSKRAPGKSTSMAQAAAKNKVDEQRHKCRNTVELACHLLGQPSLQWRSRLVLTIGRPMWKAYAKENAACHKKGVLFFVQLSFATQGYSLPCRNVFRVLQNPDLLRHVGFMFSGCQTEFYSAQVQARSSSSSRVAPSCPRRPVEAHESDDLGFEMAGVALGLACRFVARRAASMSQWMDMPPLQFVALLSKTPSVRDAALAKQRLNWQVLLEVERSLYTSPDISGVLRTIG